ncbi:MAG: hypothetical protein LAP21_15125 [Acidobacteriia bacterium]|nr:hypothetical protein [Terriglobia bacterium]
MHFAQIIAWLTAVAGIAGAIWAFWEKLMKFFTSFSTMVETWQKGRANVRRARKRADKAEEELMAFRREQEIQRTLAKIEQMENDLKKRNGINARMTHVLPAPDEDPEIVAEAWRRFEKERRKQDDQWRAK